MKIEGKNLFPLDIVYPSLVPGYYVDENGSVFSNRTKKLRRLYGTSKYVHGRQQTVVSLAETTGRAFVMGIADLFRFCKQHGDWKKHTTKEITLASLGVEESMLSKIRKNADRSHADDVEQGLKAKGSIIGRVHKGHLVFGSEPKIHLTDKSLKEEMQRLALQYPGVKFVECKIGASVVAGGVTWA